MSKRTGSICTSQSYLNNNEQMLTKLLSLTITSKDPHPKLEGHYILRCESPLFEEGDDYPEYVFGIDARGDEPKLTRLKNTGRRL